MKSRFVFSRSQQNGIFVLVAVIIVLQLIYFFAPFTSEDSETKAKQELVEKLQRSVDSLKRASETKPKSLQPFNPNFISDYKGYLLGMSVGEIDRLHAYRKQGLWINSSEEFQEVTGVSDSLLQEISGSFKFPEWKKRQASSKENPKKPFLTGTVKGDLNTATAEELQKVNGIGEKLSARIVKYRQSIGGFRGAIQLNDVYGLSPEVIDRVLAGFELKQQEFKKLSLNEATVLEISELPYIDYELARAIVEQRKRQGRFSSLEDLRQIPAFPEEKLERIALYLAAD